MFGFAGKLHPLRYREDCCARRKTVARVDKQTEGETTEDHVDDGIVETEKYDFLDADGALKRGGYVFGDFDVSVVFFGDDDYDMFLSPSRQALERDFDGDPNITILPDIVDGSRVVFTASDDDDESKTKTYEIMLPFSVGSGDLGGSFEYEGSVSDYGIEDGSAITLAFDSIQHEEDFKKILEILESFGTPDSFIDEDDIDKGIMGTKAMKRRAK